MAVSVPTAIAIGVDLPAEVEGIAGGDIAFSQTQGLTTTAGRGRATGVGSASARPGQGADAGAVGSADAGH